MKWAEWWGTGQTAGRSSRHYEGHRPDALQGSRWGGGGGRKNTSNVPDY